MSARRPNPAQNVRGHLLGHEVTTKAAVPTSAKAIGVEVDALLHPLQQGQRGKQFVSPALLAAWPDIVGGRLAGLCMPVQMKAQPKSRSRHKKAGEDGAVLEVQADPSIQIDLDYGQALILERVNGFFGYQAVSKLRVIAKARTPGRRGQPADRADRPIAPPRASPSDQEEQAAGIAVAGVADPALRASLQRLGASIFAANPRRR